ncbi:hypothetical protein C1H46_001232 [Malus baccata]|uniref:Uncharacterized protein n=1 Tax=Malus baccata TaxID=106549 RepID=A0A540NQ34_MALBA|nr:hypothetical protein C1H46_001232 [Malus baccata]
MSAYATLTRESDLENEVTNTFDFNAENLVARGQAAFFKSQITDIEKEKELCRARIEQLKKIKHGHILWDSVRRFKVFGELEMKKKNAYKAGVELFQAYAIFITQHGQNRLA